MKDDANNLIVWWRQKKNKCGVHALILDLEVVGGGERSTQDLFCRFWSLKKNGSCYVWSRQIKTPPLAKIIVVKQFEHQKAIDIFKQIEIALQFWVIHKIANCINSD